MSERRTYCKCCATHYVGDQVYCSKCGAEVERWVEPTSQPTNREAELMDAALKFLKVLTRLVQMELDRAKKKEKKEQEDTEGYGEHPLVKPVPGQVID